MPGVTGRALLVGVEVGLHLGEDLLADDRRDRHCDPVLGAAGHGSGPARAGSIADCPGGLCHLAAAGSARPARPGSARCPGGWPRSSAARPSGWAPPDGQPRRELVDGGPGFEVPVEQLRDQRRLPGLVGTASARRGRSGSRRYRTAPWSTAAACPPQLGLPARASARRSASARTPRPRRGSAAAAGHGDRRSSAGPGTPPGSHGRPAPRSAAPGGRSCGPAGPARSPGPGPARLAPRDRGAGPAPAGQSGAAVTVIAVDVLVIQLPAALGHRRAQPVKLLSMPCA